MIFVCYHFRALKAIKLIFVLVNMKCKKVPLDSQEPYRITLQKLAHFAFSMQNRIHYFRWTAGLVVVTNSFLMALKRIKAVSNYSLKPNKLNEHYSLKLPKWRALFIVPTLISQITYINMRFHL